MNDLITSTCSVSFYEMQYFAESTDSITEMVSHKLAHNLAERLIAQIPMTSNIEFCTDIKTYQMQFAALTRARYAELLRAERDLIQLRKIVQG